MPLDGERQTGNRPTVEGTVREALPNAMFAISLDNGQSILGHIAAGITTRALRVLPGDRVVVELSTYDLTRGRITRRLR